MPIIPPELNEKVYCTFVYHNDKYHGSLAKQPRDEFRLYMNNQIDPNRSYFKPDDIIVFQKFQTEDLTNLYKMNLFNAESEHYNFLNTIVEESELHGGHAVYENELNFIDCLSALIKLFS